MSPDAYRHGRGQFDPADLVDELKATIARARAEAEAARRAQTDATPDPESGDT